GGVRVAGTSIWCDAPRRHALCFVSSAHHALAGARVVTTARTLELRRALGDGAEALVTPFARPFALGRLRVELLPAGHVPGGALRAPPRIVRLLGAYVRMGLLVRTPARALRRAGDVQPGEAVLWPVELHASPALAKLPRARRLLAAGEALDPDAAARAGCAA